MSLLKSQRLLKLIARTAISILFAVGDGTG